VFGQLIDKELLIHVKSYRKYNIFVNGQQIYKPYEDVVILSRGSNEPIKKIDFIELQGESGMLGFAWIGDLSLQGIISSATGMDGLRLRCCNILIGNKDTLSGFFRERRFNNYLVGEIHVCVNELIPNSRRDDFEDNAEKDELNNSFIKEIGIPFSRKIRHLSNERAKERSSTNSGTLFENATRVIRFGYISESQKEHLINNLQAVNGNGSDQAKELASDLIENVKNSQHILSILGNQYNNNSDIMNLLGKALEIVYTETFNRPEAGKIVNELYNMISKELDKDY